MVRDDFSIDLDSIEFTSFPLCSSLLLVLIAYFGRELLVWLDFVPSSLS